MSVNFIQKLFKGRSNYWIYDLCHSKDEQNRVVIQFCSEHVRKFLIKFLYFCGRYELVPGPPIHCSATAIVVAFNDHGCMKEYELAFTEVLGDNSVSDTINFQQFQLALNCLVKTVGIKVDPIEHLQLSFNSYDGLTKRLFLQYCEKEFFAIRRVVIKFMKVEEQFRREVNIRIHGELSGAFVVAFLKGPSETEFCKCVESLTVHDGKFALADYKFGVIMPAADRSLDAIFRSERPDLSRVRSLMYEVCKCLQHVHEQGIIHGDLKMLNILRVNGNIRIIDFDASCPIGTEIGFKFSSGMIFSS